MIDKEREAFDEMMRVAVGLKRACGCCSVCWGNPCDGVSKGGMCDDMPCSCDIEDDEPEEEDYE